MAEIKIQKTVFNKPEFDNVIDRDFKFFTPPEDLEDNDTVQEIFRLYNKLYLELIKDLVVNSQDYDFIQNIPPIERGNLFKILNKRVPP